MGSQHPTTGLPAKALVVGSRGLLGKSLVRQLRNEGVRITVCNRTREERSTDPQYLLDGLEETDTDFDTVYLLAAHVPYANPNRFTQELIEANVSLVQRLSESFPQSRIVFSSSVAVYGIPTSLPISETHSFNQPNAYGLSKIAGEAIIQAHSSFCILRFSSLYGTGMQSRTFLPRIITEAIRSNEIVLHGDGMRLQDYLCVTDAAAMLRAAACSNDNVIVQAVHGTSYRNREIADIVAQRVGNTRIISSGIDDSPSFEYSSDRWRDWFEYHPRVSIEDGIGELVDGFRN